MSKSESIQLPSKFNLIVDGNKAIIVFNTNIENITKSVTPKSVNKGHRGCAIEEPENNAEEAEKVYIYDRYELTTTYRDGLKDDINNNYDMWLNFAIDKHNEAKAAEIRAERNRRLAETDKEATVDRLINKYGISSLEEIKDLPIMKYRQALRDIPEQPEFPNNVKFPPEP